MSMDLTGFDWQAYPLFRDVEESDARRFLSAGFQFRYEAGALIVSNQDLGETFFILLHGLAKLVLQSAQGEAKSIALFRPGDFFGELSMLEPNAVRNGDVLAITEVEVVAIHKRDFLQVMLDCSRLPLNLARCMGQRLRQMNERMMTDTLPHDLHKVAHTMLLLATSGKNFKETDRILLPSLSLKEWALFCYTSPDSFMNSIEKLKHVGALEWQNQRIVVTDMNKLRQYASVPETH